MNLKRLTDKAKGVVDKRGGTESLKGDMGELRTIADGRGSLKDKAKAAAEAIKKPGAAGAADSTGAGAESDASKPAGPADAPKSE
jgi:hypothetical protein